MYRLALDDLALICPCRSIACPAEGGTRLLLREAIEASTPGDQWKGRLLAIPPGQPAKGLVAIYANAAGTGLQAKPATVGAKRCSSRCRHCAVPPALRHPHHSWTLPPRMNPPN